LVLHQALVREVTPKAVEALRLELRRDAWRTAIWLCLLCFGSFFAGLLGMVVLWWFT
jgi:hypothetical protein